jgi:hypothetical protein
MFQSLTTIVQPQSIDKATFLYLKEKRLRHVSQIGLQRLVLSDDLKFFSIWFTLHADRQQRAFYISDRKDNDKSPKWTLKRFQWQYEEYFTAKAFTIRIWLVDSNGPGVKGCPATFCFWSINKKP